MTMMVTLSSGVNHHRTVKLPKALIVDLEQMLGDAKRSRENIFDVPPNS
jgi:hypothetical protein